MLVAYGPNGRSVVADDTPLEQLLCWSRERSLYCPNCRGILHVRGGPEKRTQLHFAHQKGECAWSTETNRCVMSRENRAFPLADVHNSQLLW